MNERWKYEDIIVGDGLSATAPFPSYSFPESLAESAAEVEFVSAQVDFTAGAVVANRVPFLQVRGRGAGGVEGFGGRLIGTFPSVLQVQATLVGIVTYTPDGDGYQSVNLAAGISVGNMIRSLTGLDRLEFGTFSGQVGDTQNITFRYRWRPLGITAARR